MTRTGWILTWIAVAIAALVLAVVLFITFFDWNSARPWMGQRLSNAIGRPVAIDGDLSVHWSRGPGTRGIAGWIPWPRFTARDITIANPGWAARKDFASVREVRFRLAAFALLHHTIDIPTLQLAGPAIDIERDQQGRNNWTFRFAHAGQWKLDIGKVALGAGTIRVDDAEKGLHLAIEVQPLGKSIPFDQIVPTSGSTRSSAPLPRSSQACDFAWSAHGTWRGAAARGSGKLGSVLALSNPSLKFPIEADLRLADVHIALAGTLTDPVHLGALNLNLEVSGASMSHLYPLTGVALPATGAFETRGRLLARMQQGIFKYEDFDGHVGHSDLHGTVVYATGGVRPKLFGSVHSNVLDFADLGPLVGADSNAAKSRRGETQKQPADKLLPVETFDTARWRKMDADVSFSAHRIVRKAALPIEDLDVHAVMHDGDLMLDPLKLGAAGGAIDANMRLDGRKDPMRGTARLTVRHVQLRKLFPTVDLMHASLGQINGDAALEGTGNSVAGLLGTSNGEVKLLVDNGAVSKLLLEEAGLNIANIIATKLLGDKPEKINCAAADFTAKDGIWKPRLFFIDTPDMTIDVDGSIDLGNENLDLVVHPHSKGIRVLSLRSPLYLRGTLKRPDVGVEKGPLVARAAAATVLATVAAPLAALATLVVPSHDSGNACAGVIAAMRKPAKASR